MIVPLVPPRIGYRWAEKLADLAYIYNSRTREAVLDNVKHATGLDDEEALRVVRLVFRNLAKNYYDLFRLPCLSREEIEAKVKIEGWQHFEKAFSQGKGVIVSSAHMGCPDIVVQWLANRDIPVIIPVERLEPEPLFRYICNLRMSKGIRLLPVDGPLLELARALRRGEVVGVTADRDITDSGVIVPFFGAPARLPDGPVRLAYSTGAPLVMAFNIRLPDNNFLAWVEPPIYITKSGDKEGAIQEGMRKVVSVMERYISKYPDQWVVSVPIWKAD